MRLLRDDIILAVHANRQVDSPMMTHAPRAVHVPAEAAGELQVGVGKIIDSLRIPTLDVTRYAGDRAEQPQQ